MWQFVMRCLIMMCKHLGKIGKIRELRNGHRNIAGNDGRGKFFLSEF